MLIPAVKFWTPVESSLRSVATFLPENESWILCQATYCCFSIHIPSLLYMNGSWWCLTVHLMLHCSNIGWHVPWETVFAVYCTAESPICVWLICLGALWLFHGFPWHEWQKLAALQVPVARPWSISFLLSEMDRMAQSLTRDSTARLCQFFQLIDWSLLRLLFPSLFTNLSTLWFAISWAFIFHFHAQPSRLNPAITDHWYCFK